MICEICGRPNHCRSNIELLYGGFHLVPFDRQKIEAIAYYLKNDLGVHRVAPAHCTGHLAFKVLSDLYGGDYVYAGLGEMIHFQGIGE